MVGVAVRACIILFQVRRAPGREGSILSHMVLAQLWLQSTRDSWAQPLPLTGAEGTPLPTGLLPPPGAMGQTFLQSPGARPAGKR